MTVASIARFEDNPPMIHRKAPDPIERQTGATAGDTLQVAEGEVAIFARQGQLIRVLPTGSYTVPSEFAGPDMEVFFVTTAPQHGEKFGGQLGIGLPVRMAFGQFTWVVRDPERAVTSAGFGDVSGFARWVTSTFMRELKIAVGRAHMAGEALDGVHPRAIAKANEKLAAQGIEILEVTEIQLR